MQNDEEKKKIPIKSQIKIKGESLQTLHITKGSGPRQVSRKLKQQMPYQNYFK
jgi:hypothetical protein